MTQFQTFDKNNDGVLTREEIYEGYKKLYGDAFNENEVVNKRTFLKLQSQKKIN